MRVSMGEAGYTVGLMRDEQSTEIFDDLYLGLRAGGALRKQRRGEELTEEEREALGRWQRLSAWRKGVAIGGGGGGARPSAVSPSAPSGSASPAAPSSSAAGARPDARREPRGSGLGFARRE